MASGFTQKGRHLSGVILNNLSDRGQLAVVSFVRLCFGQQRLSLGLVRLAPGLRVCPPPRLWPGGWLPETSARPEFPPRQRPRIRPAPGRRSGFVGQSAPQPASAAFSAFFLRPDAFCFLSFRCRSVSHFPAAPAALHPRQETAAPALPAAGLASCARGPPEQAGRRETAATHPVLTPHCCRRLLTRRRSTRPARSHLPGAELGPLADECLMGDFTWADFSSPCTSNGLRPVL